MPELPDVEVFKQYLDATSLHKTIRKVDVRSRKVLAGISPRMLRAALEGRSLSTTRRHGKYLFALLDGRWMVLHFGMTGSLGYFKHPEREPGYSRLVLLFANGYHLAFTSMRQLGKVGFTRDVDEYIREKKLGPDALSLCLRDFMDMLSKRRGAIKAFLMDQKRVAGIGNVYSDEILFQSRLHPLAKADGLSGKRKKALFRNMKKVLGTAIDHRADPALFPSTFLTPHRRVEGKCPRCAGALERMNVSGRTAYYCPGCQRK